MSKFLEKQISKVTVAVSEVIINVTGKWLRMTTFQKISVRLLLKTI